MDITADYIGKKALVHHCSGSVKRERAHPMTDIKDHSTFAGQQHLFSNATGHNRSVRERPETVGQDVAGTQMLKDFPEARRRQIDMSHYWQTQLFSGLNCLDERSDPASTAGDSADPDLNTYDCGGVLPRDADRLAPVKETHIGAFADHDRPGKAEDAGKGNVEESQNPRSRLFDDVAEKTRVIPGTSAAGINKGSRTARLSDGERINA
jgi:hypothetical protein